MYYRGISHAVYAICRDEGMRGLYKGLGPTLMVNLIIELILILVMVFNCF
ncbi:hypothetical protein B296_00001296 [Ensete ventricosum]|uniref:Uncharacterized protein n=1 Tax=Ensete ventricosum TaxID=4639 RepID=A0A427BBV5_ENSVE|nr:hypothetical protein B296_00001296 [Ensete ventricosum]